MRPLTLAQCQPTITRLCLSGIVLKLTRLLPSNYGYIRFNNQSVWHIQDGGQLLKEYMCHFGLSYPISLKPVGGITSHLGHKVILGSSMVSQTLTVG